MTNLDFKKFKEQSRKFSMLTCYDAWTAALLNETSVDCLLVGDSCSMVMHGENSTLGASIEMLEWHVKAVAKKANKKFIIADMPFLSYRGSIDTALANTQRLIVAGAHALKIEGAAGNETFIKRMVESGVPVVGHVGLTPQFVNLFGGFKVQGLQPEGADFIFNEAKYFQDWGASCVVLECIPSSLATTITKALNIPTVGIGAGMDCDGQVLVLQDMLGANPHFQTRFVRQYAKLSEVIIKAVDDFHKDVTEKQFPSKEESFT